MPVTQRTLPNENCNVEKCFNRQILVILLQKIIWQKLKLRCSGHCNAWRRSITFVWYTKSSSKQEMGRSDGLRPITELQAAISYFLLVTVLIAFVSLLDNFSDSCLASLSGDCILSVFSWTIFSFHSASFFRYSWLAVSNFNRYGAFSSWVRLFHFLAISFTVAFELTSIKKKKLHQATSLDTIK